MASDLFDLWWLVWGHKPSSAFVETSFAINAVSSVYEPIFQRVVDRIHIDYEAKAETAFKERTITDADREKIEIRKNQLKTDLTEFGKRTIMRAKRVAICLCFLCALFLYLDCSHSLMLILPLTPAGFYVIVHVQASQAYEKFLGEAKGYVAISCPPKEIKKEIRDSLGPSAE